MLLLVRKKLLHIFLTTVLIFVQETCTQQNNSSKNTTLQDELIRTVFQSERNETIGQEDELNTLRMVTYCTTPNGDTGYCMSLKNCTKLMDQLENEEARTFLKNSRCGSKRDTITNPKVCCGKHGTYQNLEKDPWPKPCGYQNVTIRGRILGGHPAKLGEFPWLARLYHKDRRNVKAFGCTGFLITDKFVLTAAHCVQSENVEYLGPIFEVRLGEHNTKTKIDCNTKNTTCAPKLQVIRVKDTFVHGSYNNSSRHHHHDIALLRLKKSANFTAFVSPICLIHKMDFEPFEYWLSGWGKTDENGDLSHIKMKVSVPPFPHSNCSLKYEPLRVKIINKQLCAGGIKNKDSCTGDSGGPLMLVRDGNHWFAAGVVSYGLGCGREGWPGIYTNVTSYGSWIKKTITGHVKMKDKTKPI